MKEILEGRDGVEEEVDPNNLSWCWLARIVGGKPVGNGASSVVGLYRRNQQRECHQFRRTLHLQQSAFFFFSLFFVLSGILSFPTKQTESERENGRRKGMRMENGGNPEESNKPLPFISLINNRSSKNPQPHKGLALLFLTQCLPFFV